MAFHADFWVVTGTAAPVIALAAVVQASDALVAVLPARDRGDARAVAMASYWIAGGNLMVQVAVLTLSLLSLADGSNFVPPLYVIPFQAAGFFALLLGGVSGMFAKDLVRRVRHGTSSGSPVPAEVPDAAAADGTAGEAKVS